RKKRKRRKADYTGSASFFSSGSSNAPSGLGRFASSDLSLTDFSFFSRSSRVSLLVASLPIDSFRSISSLLKNGNDDRRDRRRVNPCYKIVAHHSETTFECFESACRIWLNDVEKAEKNKRNDYRDDGPIHK